MKSFEVELFERNELVGYLYLSLVITLMCCFAYYDYLFCDKIFLITATDSLNTMLKHYIAMHHMIYDGESFFYTFNKGLGAVIGIGNPNFYGDIFAWLIALLPLDLIPQGLIYIHVLKCIVAGCLFFGFLSEFELKRDSKILGALLYVFCGHMICRSPWMHYMTEMCFMALFLWGLEKWHKNHNSYAISICLAVFLISRFATYAYVDTIYAYAYIILRELYDNETVNIKNCIREVRAFLFKYLLGIGLSAVFLVPGAIMFFSSARGNGSVEQKILANLMPESLVYILQVYLKTLMPNINGLFILPYVDTWTANSLEFPCFYTGLLAVLLALQVLGNNRIIKRKRRIFYFLLGCICIYAISPLAKSFFNGFIANHVKTASLWINVVLAVMSVYIFDRHCFSRRQLAISAALILLSALAALGYMTYLEVRLVKREVLMIFLLLPLYVFLLVKNVHSKVIIAVCIVELSACTYFYTLVSPEECWQIIVTHDDYMQYDNRYKSLAKTEDKICDFYRISIPGMSNHWFNDSLAHEYKAVSLYDGLVNKNLIEMMDYFQIYGTYKNVNTIYGIEEHPGLCNMLSVKYTVDKYQSLLTMNKDWKPFGYLYSRKISKDSIKLQNPVILDNIVQNAAILDLDSDLPELVYDVSTYKVAFKDRFVSVNDMSVNQDGYNIVYEVTGGDPVIVFSLDHPIREAFTLRLKIEGAVGEKGQVFFRSSGTDFSEEKSRIFDIEDDGYQQVYFWPLKGEPVSDIRIDIGKPGDIVKLELADVEVPRFNLLETLPQEAINITSFSDKCIKGNTTLTEPRIAFFSIPYDDGWKIYDNGKPVEKMKVNIGFMGIYLKPGEHEIELRYRLPGLYEGAAISFVSLLMLAYFYRREKKSQRIG